MMHLGSPTAKLSPHSLVRLLGAGALCAALAMALVPPPAHAQSKSTEQVQERAKTHFRTGQKLVKQGRYDEAYSEFQKGHRLSSRPLFLFNMGEAARAADHHDKAIDAYERYLEADPDGQLASTARKRIKELRAKQPRKAKPAKAKPAKAKPVKPAATAEPTPKPAAEPLPTAPIPDPCSGSADPCAAQVDTMLTTPTAPKRTASGGTPLWKRWELWAGVGAAVAVGSIAIYATSDSGDPACGADCTVIDVR